MLVGRDAERARIGALLEAAHASRSGALVLRGEPGIGKTALLEDAREQAAGMHVLSARGLESESELPFAGLHQLVLPALHLVDQLPGPQALALQGALGLVDHSGDDRFLISAACLTLLSALAEEQPVLCVIDDAHWLDAPSSDALLFVARRLGAEGIAMLFAARDGEPRRFEARELAALELSELDAASAASLLESQVEGALDEGVRQLLVERARGNALALVELPAALSAAQLAGAEPVPDTLPLSRGVEQLFLARVCRLPEPTQRFLLLLAADDGGTLAPILEAAAALGIPADAIDAAESARLVRVRDSSVAFQHPLVRSTIYHAASSSERRAVHLALANALRGDLETDQHAWHRAAGALGPDSEIAEELERAARGARLRSGHAAAASAMKRAAELSVDDDSRARRLVAAARAAWDAGQPERALALLDAASPLAGDAQVRAELDHVRGEIQFWCGVLLDAYDTLSAGAANIADIDTRKALAMLFDAANACVVAGDYRRVAEAGRRAEALPASDNERDALLTGLLIGVGSLQEGKSPQELPRLLEVVDRADDFDEPRWLVWASGGAQVVGDEHKAADFMRRAVALARGSARLDQLVPSLASLVLGGLVEGRFAVAGEAEEGLKLARHARMQNLTTIFLAALAWLAALKGHDDECRMYAAEANEGAQATGAALSCAIAQWALSIVDLTRGRPMDAAVRLRSVRDPAPGVGHPYIGLLSTPDLVEALVRTGRRQEAQGEFGALDAFTQPGAPAWALALEARCRALLSANDEAEGAFVEALGLHGATDRPFDRARTRLLYGEFLRRERRRTDAREQLRAALTGFEDLGAEAWAARARAELRASGERARKRDPSTIAQLTPQELQIARFVAEGLSNKEVAAQLFLSPRTIDYHLRNIFTKLGITSRTQLARLSLAERETVTPVRATIGG